MDLLPLVVTHNDLPPPSLMLNSEVAVLPLATTSNVPPHDLRNHDSDEPPTPEMSSNIESYPHISRVPGSEAASPSPLSSVSASYVYAALSDTISSIHPAISSEPPLSPSALAIPSTSSTNVADRSAEQHGDLPPLPSVSHSPAGAEAAAESGQPPNASQDIFGLSLDFFSDSIPERDARRAPRPNLFSDDFFRRQGLTASNRAEALISCMEVVPDELVIRYEKLRSSDSDGVDGCAICQDNLVDAKSSNCTPDTNEGSDASSSVAFSCAGKHLFHRDCLLPWLARMTTCPYCRFDIDPQFRISIRDPLRAWKPPVVESMLDWLAAEEKARETGVPREPPVVVMPEYPAESPLLAALRPTARRSDFSPRRVFLFDAPLEWEDLNAITSSDDSSLNFERDFAAWFYPENANGSPLISPEALPQAPLRSTFDAISDTPQEETPRVDGPVPDMGDASTTFERDFAAWFERDDAYSPTGTMSSGSVSSDDDNDDDNNDNDDASSRTSPA